MSSKNFGRSASGISGSACIVICRMAESTFGAGLKWEGGTLAMSFGVPKGSTWRAKTLFPVVIFLATSFWTSSVICLGRLLAGCSRRK